MTGRFDMNHVHNWSVLDRLTQQTRPLPAPTPPETDDMKIITHLTVQASFNAATGLILSDDEYHQAVDDGATVIPSDHPETLQMFCDRNGPAVAFELGRRAERFKPT